VIFRLKEELKIFDIFFSTQLQKEAAMTQVEFTEEDKQALNYERYHHPHPRVQRKMEALWLKSQGESHKRIGQLTGVTANMISQYIKEYAAGGIQRLKELHFRQPQTELLKYQQTLEDYFKTHPPATLKEAMKEIERLTGLKRGQTQIAKFFAKLGFKWRKVGSIPAKADPDKQEAFKKNTSNPGSKKPKPAKGRSFLWMPLTLS
jgi:transposase